MRALLGAVLMVFSASAGERTFELHVQLEPPAPGSISLHASTTPFSTAGLADASGRVRFKGLLAGPYTVSGFVRGYGEVRQTVEVSPSLADNKGRVQVVLQVKTTGSMPESSRQRAKVSARQLSIPDRALREYGEAQKKLERRQVEAAIAHLEKAVEIAPQFANAWNNLGTIAYQTGKFAQAEAHFREALVQEPEAYEPLVNLGGALLTQGKIDEALAFNLHAVSRRPEDALANSQLGINYAFLGKLDLGIKYLNIAKKLDPAHFSNPQLTLAEIHLRRNDRRAAAGELEEFLRLRPDWPAAAGIRQAIEKLRSER